MAQKPRQDAILDILEKEGYVTVAYLTKRLHYSTATINRDLNTLAEQGLVHRSYGGVELVKNHVPTLSFRYFLKQTEKRLIAHAAAKLVQPGDTIFVDGSSTTELMAPYLKDIERLTVITNNMALASYLSEYGVPVVCLGGQVVEPPHMLGGNMTSQQAAMYRADKVFFTTAGFTPTGMIGGVLNSVYLPLMQAMMANAEKSYYLGDRKKLDWSIEEYCFDFGKLTGIISDYDFPAETKEKFPDTQFVCVKKTET